MKRMVSRTSNSWWLDENLEETDRLVKEMLKLIEEGGDSVAKKAEMSCKRRPELINHVENFYRLHRALAERYDHLTGELGKNIPSVNALETTKRMVSRESHFWWWASQICPQNSRWLAENLEEMDRVVKEMLKLIEEDGDSFAKRAEMYYKRRPELFNHVENFYRMYRALAERYDHVTGELRNNIPSGLQSQGSAAISAFGSPLPSPPLSLLHEQIPEGKPTRSKSRARAAGFQLFLGSGEGSEGSSSSSESESESGTNDDKEMSGDVDPDHLCPRIIQLERELDDMKEKLQQYEQSSSYSSGRMEAVDEQGHPSRVAELEAELAAANEKLQGLQEVIEQLRQDLEKKVQVEVERGFRTE